jgi:hypothetical protein
MATGLRNQYIKIAQGRSKQGTRSKIIKGRGVQCLQN